jgi:hypothetical protein
MESKGIVFLFSVPGDRTRRFVVTRRRLISATFFAVFALASGFWAGWQISRTSGSIPQLKYGGQP